MSAQAGLELAAGLEQAGRHAEAEAAYQRHIDGQPQDAVARFNYACFLRRRGRLEQALESHQAALDLAIQKPEEVLSNMAVIQAELRRDAAAKLLLERALAVNPTYVPALFNLALHHEEFGDRERARAMFRRILSIDPNWHEALVHLAHAETVGDPDGELVRRLRRTLRRSNLAPLARESLHFALGKALDDCGRYDEAFEQYALGNAQSRPRLARYDRALVDQHVGRILEAFNPELLARAAPVSEAPLIFITGMFRSGSTLLEQVLAAHPAVTAGGEIEYFMRFPISLEPADWPAIAQGYVDYLQRTFPGREIVTNKRPDAFAWLGMLRASFPNARFVNTVRDARDTALSIFFQQFDGRLGYAADLADIADHRRQCQRLMAHWRGLFGDAIYDADYDAFVKDPRAQTERLLAFLGLPWHEGCLEFHRSGNRVRTASVSQVREPLYARSSGRWKNYERQLAPFLPALGSG